MTIGVAGFSRSTVRRALLAGGLFAGFVPYAAIPYGRSSAVQVSQALLIAAGVLGDRVKRRVLVALTVLLVAPLVVALAASVARHNLLYSSGIGVKASINLSLSIATMVGASAIVELRDCAWIVKALSSAIFVNAVVGLYQYTSFHAGRFPLGWMYVLNPTFAPWNADAIDAFLIAGPRPFGLFSEPSAMAACIGPWIGVLVVMLVLVDRGGFAFSAGWRWFTALSTAAGALLVAASSSGISLFAIVGLLIVIGRLALNRRNARGMLAEGLASRRVLRGLLALMGGAGVVGVLRLESRYGTNGGTINSSWSLRASSIAYGVNLWLDSASHFVFGLGPGQVPVVMSKFPRGFVKSYGFVRIVTVWSILIKYIVETGMVGLVSVLSVVGRSLGGVLRAAGQRVEWATIFIVWLVGVIATTSYSTLTPVWLLLGVFCTLDGPLGKSIGGDTPSRLSVLA